jgi:putative ATP-dependent endonuclease of OLD family
MDVMPNCAPQIIGRVKSGEAWPNKADRKWRAKRDYTDTELIQKKNEKKAKASEQSVQTFVSNEWTLEYDLALGPKNGDKFSCGMAEDVFIAACLAEKDDDINAGKTTVLAVEKLAQIAFSSHKNAPSSADGHSPEEVLASHIYAKFTRNKVSKAITAQYLAQRLFCKYKNKTITASSLRQMLPTYIAEAIDYVTGVSSIPLPSGGEFNGK